MEEKVSRSREETKREKEEEIGEDVTDYVFFFPFLFFLFITIYRWFILSDNCLFYFKAPSDVEPCGIIPLESILLLSPSLIPLVPPSLLLPSCPLLLFLPFEWMQRCHSNDSASQREQACPLFHATEPHAGAHEGVQGGL